MKQVPEKLKKSAPEGTIWFGGPIDKSKVSMRIVGDNLDPDKISKMLKCTPTVSFKKGDTIKSKIKDRIVQIGRWDLKSDLSVETDLEEKVWDILGRVTSEKDIWDSITSQYEVDLFCGVFLNDTNGGFSLSVKLMGELSRLGIEIGFDIYGA